MVNLAPKWCLITRALLTQSFSKEKPFHVGHASFDMASRVTARGSPATATAELAANMRQHQVAIKIDDQQQSWPPDSLNGTTVSRSKADHLGSRGPGSLTGMILWTVIQWPLTQCYPRCGSTSTPMTLSVESAPRIGLFKEFHSQSKFVPLADSKFNFRWTLENWSGAAAALAWLRLDEG